MDQGTIDHEFDELLQKVSPHEEDGIRYKKFKKILRPILSVLSVIPSPIQPFAAIGSAAMAGYNINKHGFNIPDALSIAGGGIGGANLIKGLNTASTTAGSAGAAGNLSSAADVGANLGYTAGMNSAVAPGFTAANAAAQSAGSGAMDAFQTIAQGASGIPQGSSSGGGGGGSSPNPPPTFKSSVTGTTYDTLEQANQVSQNVRDVTSAAAGPIVNSLAGQSVGGAPTQGAYGAGPGALSRFGTLNPAGDLNRPAVDQSALDEAFGKIDANSAQRVGQVRDMFRGQRPGDNTAYARQLVNINQSTQGEKQQFLSEADKANQDKYKTMVRTDLMKRNNLNDSQFTELFNLAQSGSDDQIKAKVRQDPNEFRAIFKPLF
jgi:hypothetical protein